MSPGPILADPGPVNGRDDACACDTGLLTVFTAAVPEFFAGPDSGGGAPRPSPAIELTLRGSCGC